MRVVVISNPNATDTTVRERDVLAHALGSGADLQIAETAHRGHAAALACRAMRERVDVVVALGGDGTVNEVVNGLLTDGVHDEVPSLGIVPGGSTNVFARALGLPVNRTEATGVLLEGIRTGGGRHVSVGKVDDRWFVFAAGVGYDAAVVEGVERHRRRGKRSTHQLYARVGLRQYLAYDRRHPKLTIELPGGETIEDIYFAVIANADPWTFVGNRALRVTPEVDFDTGLGVYARRRMGAPGIIFSMVRALRAHPRIGKRGARVVYDLNDLVIRCAEPMPLQVDGDLLEPREKMHFRSVDRAIRVICPDA